MKIFALSLGSYKNCEVPGLICRFVPNNNFRTIFGYPNLFFLKMAELN